MIDGDRIRPHGGSSGPSATRRAGTVVRRGRDRLTIELGVRAFSAAGAPDLAGDRPAPGGTLIREIFPAQRAIESSADLESAYDPGPGPSVRVDFVTSLDGATEIDGRSGALGGPADRAAFVAMRAVTDVILVGAGTVRAERYGPVKLDPEIQQRRVARGQTPLPRLAVVTARGDLPPDLRLFDGEERPIVLTTSLGAQADPTMPTRAEVIDCGPREVDLYAAVGQLRRLGFARILSEGGPSLVHGLLMRDLLDELCLTISPVIAGAGPRRLTGNGALPTPARLHLLQVFEGDGLILTRYGRDK